MKKILSLLLALVMVFSLAACGNGDTTESGDPANSNKPVNSGTPNGSGDEGDGYVGPDWDAIDAMDYEEMSDTLYDWNLGEFYDTYMVAKAEMDDLDLRSALMAVAEAKMLESGVFMPIYGDGGAYAMNRLVPRTVTTTSWGLDENKWYTALVCNELITSEDRDTLIGLWSEAADADTFLSDAKEWLADNGYTLNDTWNMFSTYDMETWDIIATSYQSDSYHIACTVAGLLEYDAKNVQQPSLATSYDVSADGKVYTFHIREGVNWVDQQGRVLEPVTANDWVASMMHVADNNDELGYLMTTSDGVGIKNYDRYMAGECTFDEVGVKAIDDYTLEYTLEAKFPAFATALGYGCFAPLNYNFYKSQGGTFGAEGDTYTPGNYGTSPATIAYCGPYLVTNYTAQNVWTYKANPEFWNADAVNVSTVNFYYNDNTDVMRTYNEAKAGTVAGCSFNSSALVQAQSETPDGETETYFDLYHYTTTNSATCYVAWLNLNRATFHDFNDESSGVSPKADDPDAQALTREAMNNKHFRLAMAYAFDRGTYNAQGVGEDLKYASLKNSYTPGDFYQLQNSVTIDINGTSTTFPAGTYYGEIMQAQLTADGYPIKVWDPTAEGGVGSGDGFDGWYNVNEAVRELDLALADLADLGYEVTAENPIQIDTFYAAYSETNTNTKNAYKQNIENALGGKVVVNLVGYDDGVTMQYAYYRNSTGAEANFDISHNSGWGPDYGDPQTYLDTIQPFGYMCKNLGIY